MTNKSPLIEVLKSLNIFLEKELKDLQNKSVLDTVSIQIAEDRLSDNRLVIAIAEKETHE